MACLTCVILMPLLSNIKTAQAVIMIRSNDYFYVIPTLFQQHYSCCLFCPQVNMCTFTMQRDGVSYQQRA